MIETAVQPTYDEMLPSDLVALEAMKSPHTLALWTIRLNRWEWPEELAPCEPVGPVIETHEEWKARAPDRRDDITEWIKNKIGAKYILMVFQCEMLSIGTPDGPLMLTKSEAEFEKWWNEPYPGDPSITRGENHLRSAAWWAKTREEWRAVRKSRTNRS